MTSIIEKVQNSLQKYKSIGEGKATIAEREKLMIQLRIDMTFFENLPPANPVDQRECILAREIYEYACFLSVEKEDIEGFERNFTIVKTYYDEFSTILPESQKKYSLIGLYLMYLLSFNKISEYHTEIELLPYEELNNNVFIRVPVSLEQYFVEGSYGKILTSKQNIPLQAYQVFVDKFTDAIRYEIARSAERAYESLSLQALGKMLMIENPADLQSFITTNNGKDNVNWELNQSDNRVYFRAQLKETKEIPSIKMINMSLEYATEMNRII
jgi:26S proteasome regulatory subunit N12